MSAYPTIALIDDDRTWLETLSEVLRDRGFAVEIAVGGARGLELLAEGKIHLAIVDFHMPDCDGLELVRLLRARRIEVEVLLMSSDDDPTLPGRAIGEGAAAFLSKSQAPTVLLQTLVSALLATVGSLMGRPLTVSRWDRFLPAIRRPRLLESAPSGRTRPWGE